MVLSSDFRLKVENVGEMIRVNVYIHTDKY